MELSILNLLLVLLAAWVAGSVVSRFGYPAIFGELMAGIIFGPPLLGLLEPSEALHVLAEVGVLLMMLYIGMEIDPNELFKASLGGFLAAIGGFITPFALSYVVVVYGFDQSSMAGIFVGIAAGVTSLATKSRILSDLNMLDTRIAHVMMAGALVADTLSLIVFAGVISVVDLGTVDAGQLVLVTVEVVIFFALSIFLGIKVFPIIWRRLSQVGLTSRTFYATFLLLITLLFAEMAELAGLHAILGAFLAGLFVREGIGVERRVAHELTELVRDVSIGFLAPIFFVTAGFNVSLDTLTNPDTLGLLVAIILVATIGKIIGTTLFYMASGSGWREGIVIGAGMNGRGAVEIIIAEIALEADIINTEIFSVLVFMAIFTTGTVPVFLKWGTDWLKERGELVRASDERTGAVIVGAGTTARALAKELSKTCPVYLIDSNRGNVLTAKEEGLNALYGDALAVDNLLEAKVNEARWFIVLTPNSEINLLAAQIARNTFDVPELLVRLTNQEESSLKRMVSDIGANPVFDHDVNINEWDLVIDDSQTLETIEIVVEKAQDKDKETLWKELAGGDESLLPLLVKRNEEVMPYFAVKTLEVKDRVVFLKPA